MPDPASRRVGAHEGDLLPEAAALEADAQLQACVADTRKRLRARGVGGGRKGRAVSARADEALLAGADTFGAWLMSQAGTLDAALDVDV